MRLICEQYASKEIAALTQLTVKTVETYRSHILEKTGARNVAGIVIYAMTHGYYQPSKK
jgi:DNA-binding CsgD family transcriptional regulator